MTARPLPLWTAAVLAVLFVPPVLAHEAVFGNGVGLIAAGAGVVAGLLVAIAATKWSWDVFTTAVVTATVYLMLGGAAALRPTTIAGVVPTAKTLQLLVLGSFSSWKDLLTLDPPAASYTGPSVLPWLTGLLCGVAAGLLTIRLGRYLLGTIPIAAMGLIGVAWGLGGQRPPAWPVAVWTVAVLAWWGWCAQQGRVASGEDIVVGRQALAGTGGVTQESLHTSTGTRVSLVYAGRRVGFALLTLLLAAGVAVPLATSYQGFAYRTVLRDLVQPPLDVQEYPSPLAAFRYYTTGAMARTTLVTVSTLPQDARVRLAVMDTYNGIAFGMSDPATGAQGRYVLAGTRFAETGATTGTDVTVDVTTSGLVGPWLPAMGNPDTLTFTGANATDLQAGLYVNRWANSVLTTAMPADGTTSYTFHSVVPPVWADGQLEGVPTTAMTGTPDTNVPDQVSALAQAITAKELTQLARARAIERYLSKTGFFSNDTTADSRSGHRADRLIRMLDADQLIGDDEQYAALMALMLHSLGIPARVVMGLYPSGPHAAGVPLELKGSDMHAWVEVEFSGIGWATFDPTPPRDQVPQTSAQRPRSVPRPQVLQPPDPPEAPVELPPAMTQKGNEGTGTNVTPFPWALVGGIAGGALVVLGPLAAILLLKLRRASKRRHAADPSLGVAGAWDETVDAAVDAGAKVPRDLTRQEAAQLLSTTVFADAGSGAGARTPAAPAAPLWYVTGDAVPAAIALARRADTATFAAAPPEAADVSAAWKESDGLRRQLARSTGWLSRVGRRLSLRSLRRRGTTGASGRGLLSRLPFRRKAAS